MLSKKIKSLIAYLRINYDNKIEKSTQFFLLIFEFKIKKKKSKQKQ